ncbi:MAG TPA: TIR domain-containing protein, partial [Propionibacteriaceae bacterium]|nr:TIR domain-containing protein [Propionibacteriaceae bacterium]
TKSGYVQKELLSALDVAAEQPEGGAYLIPVRLEECEMPDRLRRWHWVNLFEDGGYERLLRGLRS